MKTLFPMALFLVACSGDDGKAPACDLAHRDGAYLQHHEERADGTCGAIQDTVVSLHGDNDMNTVPAGCAVDDDDRVSADQCDLTRKFTCPLDGVPGTISVTAVTSEEGGGAKVTGIFTVLIKDGDGAFVCTSTYDVTSTRQ